MPAYYSIVQYQPDEVTDERINIGVVVFDTSGVQTHFIDNWQRVRQFARRDISAVQEFAERAHTMSETAIKRAIETWTHTLHLTEPSPSLRDSRDLLIHMSARFLVDPAREQRGYWLRGDAVRIARREVRLQLVARLGGLGKLYLKGERSPIVGARSPHAFDISVGNGHPFFAAQALSFQIPDMVKVTREVDAAAWAIKDVQEALPNLPIAVVAFPPAQNVNQDIFNRARKTFAELNAQVVPEAELRQWADQMIDATVPKPSVGN